MVNKTCSNNSNMLYKRTIFLTKDSVTFMLSSIESIKVTDTFLCVACFFSKIYIISRNCSPLNQLLDFGLRCPQRGFVFSGGSYAY